MKLLYVAPGESFSWNWFWNQNMKCLNHSGNGQLGIVRDSPTQKTTEIYIPLGYDKGRLPVITGYKGLSPDPFITPAI